MINLFTGVFTLHSGQENENFLQTNINHDSVYWAHRACPNVPTSWQPRSLISGEVVQRLRFIWSKRDCACELGDVVRWDPPATTFAQRIKRSLPPWAVLARAKQRLGHVAERVSDSTSNGSLKGLSVLFSVVDTVNEA